MNYQHPEQVIYHLLFITGMILFCIYCVKKIGKND